MTLGTPVVVAYPESDTVRVREAVETDVGGIRDIFHACYGDEYSYPEFYDPQALKRMAFSDDALMLVAEAKEDGRLLGTASVLFDIGAYTDLIGEFGRLAVHPDARNHGVGRLLMEGRLAGIEDRLHMALVEARVTHPFSMKISQRHGFALTGFLPLKHEFDFRESVALHVRYFGDALALRRPDPRLIPEVQPLAATAMQNVGLPADLRLDEDTPAYPTGIDATIESLTTEGYAPLLRIERGRVRRREIFGPMRLQYGFFKLRSRNSNYFLARRDGQIVGAVGFTHDPVDRTIRVFELVSLQDDVIRFLLEEMARRSRREWGIEYIEIDVSAHSPRMQRTLIELDYVPAAYIPAMVFHDAHRLDVIKMVRLFPCFTLETCVDEIQAFKIVQMVARGFRTREVLPDLTLGIARVPLLESMDDEQIYRIASVCRIASFPRDREIFRAGVPSGRLYVILEGEVEIRDREGTPVGSVGPGESLAETSMLTRAPHSATAVSRTPVRAVILDHQELASLIRLRPDIGLVLYRNLARELAHTLRRVRDEREGGS